jgi:hypothetical protein
VVPIKGKASIAENKQFVMPGAPEKARAVTNATDGKSKFLSIEYQDLTIKVVGPAAIVRFHWIAEQEMAADGEKSADQPSDPDEQQKQGDDWKLLSRAATKL